VFAVASLTSMASRRLRISARLSLIIMVGYKLNEN
jgi:hypothetical protein